MDKPSRILVIQLKRAGDVIVTTPVLAALRASFPNAEIDFLVDKPFAPLLAHHPLLRDVIVYDRQSPWAMLQKLRERRYDWILDFQSSPRSILAGLCMGAKLRAGYRVTFWGRFFTVGMRRPGADVSVTEGKMNLLRTLWPSAAPAGERQIYLTPEERAWAEGLAKSHAPTRAPIGLIPTHRRNSRRWLRNHFIETGKDFNNKGLSVWLFWGPGEEDYVQELAREIPGSWMIPKTSMREMAALLACCQLVISNDNGPMHAATAVGVPTVTLYGPTDPSAWNPGGLRHRALQVQGLRCLGCNLNECPFGHECMKDLTPSLVLKEAESLLAVTAGVRT